VSRTLRGIADRYQFRSATIPEGWPAIIEPAPSVVWDLSPVFDGDYPGGFNAGSRDVADLVLGTLQDCIEWWESIVSHDWVHPSCLFRPHKVDEPEEVPDWDVGGLFPNGDYTTFVGRDDAFGILGHPWERSLCVFGRSSGVHRPQSGNPDHRPGPRRASGPMTTSPPGVVRPTARRRA
jgi:hypothetical protein